MTRFISVCLSIVMDKYWSGMDYIEYFSPEWRMGSCYGPKLGGFSEYVPTEVHIDKCCLPPGKYTLNCKNTKSKYGWGNYIFTINGKRYCDDFVGFKAMRIVLIDGI